MNFLNFEINSNCSFSVTNYYSYNYEYFDMEPHRHHNAEIMYAQHGKCKVLIGNEEISLKKGQLILIASDISHRLSISHDSHCKIVNVEFCPVNSNYGLLNELMECHEAAALYSSVSGYAVIYDASSEVLTLMKKIIKELISTDYLLVSDTAVNTYLVSLLIEIVRQYYFRKDSSSGLVQRILEYTATEYYNSISTKDVAEHFNQNSIYIERVFKESTGETITEHIIRLRLNNALKLMSATTLPLIDIAMQCGFNSRQNFYVAFTKRYGATPKDYRIRINESYQDEFCQTPFISKTNNK